MFSAIPEMRFGASRDGGSFSGAADRQLAENSRLGSKRENRALGLCLATLKPQTTQRDSWHLSGRTASGPSVYLYDGDSAVEEIDPNGNLLARYTDGERIDEPLAESRSGSASYYEADALGSITSLTGSSGTIANTYNYDAFGNLFASTGTTTNFLRYTAREVDAETGIYYYRRRYYDSGIGRFTVEDSNDGGSLYDAPNLYLYVENNPANWIDPLGLYTLKKGGSYPPLPPSPEIDALLRCIELKTGLYLFVTSTSEATPQHLPGTPHRRGVAVDVRYNPGTADKILCAAKECGAGYGLDEAKHPSKNATGPHIHVQIPPGTKGGHGDLPNGGCGCSSR